MKTVEELAIERAHTRLEWRETGDAKARRRLDAIERQLREIATEEAAKPRPPKPEPASHRGVPDAPTLVEVVEACRLLRKVGYATLEVDLVCRSLLRQRGLDEGAAAYGINHIRHAVETIMRDARDG